MLLVIQSCISVQCPRARTGSIYRQSHPVTQIIMASQTVYKHMPFYNAQDDGECLNDFEFTQNMSSLHIYHVLHTISSFTPNMWSFTQNRSSFTQKMASFTQKMSWA